MTTTLETLDLVQDAGLLELHLRRPPLNEIGEATLADLEAALDRLEASDATGLLVTSDLPGGFCAGADLRALHEAIEARGHAAVTREVRDFLHRINRALVRLEAQPRPTCAALHGVVFGGGLELALACDLRVADRTARLAFPELRLGLVPGFGGLVRLLREGGAGRARDVLLTGRSLGAEAARQAGLVGDVVAEGRAVEVARRTLLQATRQDRAACAALKARLAPPQPDALRDDVDLFCRLFERPEVARALARFVARDGAEPLPYLAEGTDAGARC